MVMNCFYLKRLSYLCQNGDWLYTFSVMQLGKVTINVGNHQNRIFHSKLLDMMPLCISYINISLDYYDNNCNGY